MRNFLFSIAIIITCSGVSAQINKVNPESSKRIKTQSLLGNLWSIAEHDDSFSPEHPNPTSITYFVRIGADSTINSTLYHSIDISYDTLLANWSTTGFIRYAENGDVYYKPINEPEYLLYSFNINESDTLILYGFSAYPHLSAYVQEQDSMLIDNVYRKRFNILYLESGFQEVWVEGIGSLSSFLRHITDHAIGNYITREVLCFHHDNDQLYQNPVYPGCIYFNTTDIQDVVSAKPFLIVPNPVYDYFFFETNSNFNTIEIFNSTGHMVKSIDSENTFEPTKISKLTPGNYILRAIGNDEVWVEKFVVIR